MSGKNTNMRQILDLVYFTEGLKKELRHSYLSDGRQESVAEHSWRVALMVMFLKDKFEVEFDLLKTLKMSLIHDLVEIIATDIPLFETEGNLQSSDKKYKSECEAILKIKEIAGGTLGDEIENLWNEHENQTSIESKIVRAMDKLEAQIQHNQADISTWTDWEKDRVYSGKLEEESSFNDAVSEFCSHIVNDASEKIKTNKEF